MEPKADRDSGHGGAKPRRSPHLVVLMVVALALLLGCVGLSLFLPAVELYFSFRILALATVVAAMAALAALVRRTPDGEAAKSPDRVRRVLGLRVQVWIASAFLGMLAVYITLTFAFPVLLQKVSIRILALTVVAGSFLGYFGIERTLKRERLASGTNGAARSEGLGRRFFASLGVFLLLPVYVIALYLHPGLQDVAEMRIVVLAIILAALIGFWSVANDILELMRILKKAQLIAHKGLSEPIITSRNGEIHELANAFNIVAAELNATIEELKQAKRRIESLVARIGAAVSSSGDPKEVLKIVLDVSADALRARSGLLHILKTEEDGVMEITTQDKGNGRRDDALRQQIEVVITSGEPLQEGNRLLLPLKRGKRLLGALGLERPENVEPFTREECELLTGVADQAALALETIELRANEESMYFATLTALAVAIEARDPYTRGHSQRVSQLATAIARQLGMGQSELDLVRDSALLHDIGKVGIPDSILRKPGPLSNAEYEVIKQHTVTGEYILRPARPLHKLLGPVRSHHERFDGKGYPDAIPGERLDKKAMVIAVADAFDAMLSDRPYRSAYEMAKAKEEIRKGTGSQFWPTAARALLELVQRGGLPVKYGELHMGTQPAAQAADVRIAGA